MKKTLSSNMIDITKSILQDKSTNVNKISAVLYSVSDPTFTLTLEDIELTIHQDHVRKYTDVIKLFFTLSLKDYIKIISVYQDLRCNIFILNHYDNSLNKRTEKPGIKLDKKVIFETKDDLFKTYHKSDIISDDKIVRTEAQNSQRVPVHAELIDDILFDARKFEFNMICRNTDVEHVLHLITGLLQPKFKCILKPDNETIFPNFPIPGMKNLSETFKFIDQQCGGIYDAGLGYYWTEDTLFIYPLYNFEPEISPYIVHFYFVGENSLTGGGNFHTYKNDCYHVITNKKPTSTQLMEQSAENIGNGFLIQRNSLLFDKWRVQEESEFVVIPDGIIRMQVDNSNTMSAFSHNMKFVYGEENLADCKASLAMMNGTVTKIEWEHAVPFIVKPGWKIMYHYDGEETYEIKSGCCIGASYRYVSAGREGADRLYTCHAELALFTN